MSTPGFFKSFRHDTSKQIYTAAAARLNNPIAIADKERKVLWSEAQSAGYTDLIVSIGTGLEAEPNRLASGSVKSGAPSIVGTLRKFSLQLDSTRKLS